MEFRTIVVVFHLFCLIHLIHSICCLVSQNVDNTESCCSLIILTSLLGFNGIICLLTLHVKGNELLCRWMAFYPCRQEVAPPANDGHFVLDIAQSILLL